MKAKIFRLRHLITIILILLVTQTCKKDEVTEIDPDEFIVSEEVNIISDADWDASFISFDTISSTLTLSADIANNLEIKQGDILVSAKGDSLLRKVSSIQTIDNKLIIATSDASLTEAVKQGTFEFDTALTVSQIKSIEYYYEGISLKKQNLKSSNGELFDWDINTVIYDMDGQSLTKNDQIKLIGNFNCKWTLKGKVDIGLLKGLKEVHFGFKSSEELNLKLIAGIEYNLEKKIKIATVRFSPFVIWPPGPIPLIFTPKMEIFVGINGYANASITTGIEQSLSFEAGVRYLKDAGWNPYEHSDEHFSFQPPRLNFNAGAEAYVKPEITMKLYGLAGPYANLKLYSRLDADLLATPWWKLSAGIKMSAGGRFDILDKFLIEFEVSDLLEHEELIAQATNPPNQAPTVTTSNIADINESSAKTGGNVTDDGGENIIARGVCWSTSQNPTTANNKTNNGTSTGLFTSSLTGLLANTNYYVRAYAINSVGTGYGKEQSFTTSTLGTAPVTNFTASLTSITSGQSIQFTDQSSNTPTGWSWDFGDGNTSTSQNPSHTYSTAGSYTISLTATNSFGSDTETKTNYITVAESGDTGTVTDYDGNVYNTATIGNQEWMAENLKVTHYTNGTAIPLVTDNTVWANLGDNNTDKAYCYYNNNTNNEADTYGALYTYAAATNGDNDGTTQGVCPTGWHLPSDAEWKELEVYLGMTQTDVDATGWRGTNEGSKLAGNTLLWDNGSLDTNVEFGTSGFSALPAGRRFTSGIFENIGSHAYWWMSNIYSSIDGRLRVINYSYSSMGRGNNRKGIGLSIRCLKN